MKKVIIFDLDDTLINDKKSIDNAFRATCGIVNSQHGIDSIQLEKKVREFARELYSSYDTYRFTKRIGINPFEGLWGTFVDNGEDFQKLREIAPVYQLDVWRMGLREFGIEDEGLAKKLSMAFPMFRKRYAFVFSEVFPVLEQLKEQYQLVLLTNGSPSLQRTKLSLSPKLGNYFDSVFISGDYGIGKPDPSIFQHVLESVMVEKEEVIMVGDNLHTDILGANRVGITNVWINRKAIEAVDIRPTFEIRTLDELTPVLQEL
ncbi:HAD family hydrolase [Ornithinibacillus xuwenensis]|uniref:Phosphoserine phosphatase n=1 Tax=Ornithinibacillus xuwenensis TaxID=3144668 RepID=A0ABU9XLU4_9BACI